MNNILIIEDDPDIREVIRLLLENDGYTVTEAANGVNGLQLLTEDTDLVILDIMMLGMSGLKTCEKLRQHSTVPVLFLTARVQESDKLLGLMAGGDDYLTKPFSCAELLGRIKALIRRYRKYNQSWKCPSIESHIIHSGNILVNEEKGTVSINGKEINLTSIEFQLLLLFIKHPGRIYPTQVLYEQIWNEPYFYSCNGTVMVHIRKLRKKIEETPSNPCLIQTVWGKGYKFHEENQ